MFFYGAHGNESLFDSACTSWYFAHQFSASFAIPHEQENQTCPFFILLLHFLCKQSMQSRELILNSSAPLVDRTAWFRYRKLHPLQVNQTDPQSDSSDSVPGF